MTKRIYIPIYDYYVDIHCYNDITKLDKLNNTILEKAGFEAEDGIHAQARFYPAFIEEKGHKRICSIIFNTDFIGYELITHEIFHLVYFISVMSDFKLNSESEECFAYLTGYVSEQIFKVLKQYL